RGRFVAHHCDLAMLEGRRARGSGRFGAREGPLRKRRKQRMFRDMKCISSAALVAFVLTLVPVGMARAWADDTTPVVPTQPTPAPSDGPQSQGSEPAPAPQAAGPSRQSWQTYQPEPGYDLERRNSYQLYLNSMYHDGSNMRTGGIALVTLGGALF